MALIVDIKENKLKENLLEIQKFNDKQINFYRKNESSYYHYILEIIHFIKNHEIEELSHCFYQDKNFIKDFKDLFLELTSSKEYHRTPQKKSNFYSTIIKLIEKISKYKEEKSRELTSVQTELANYKKEFSDIQDTLEKYKETFKLFNNSVKEKEDFLNQKNDEILKIKQNAENAF